MPRLQKIVKGRRYQVGRFAGSWYVADLDRNRFIYGPFVRRETAEARIQKIIHQSRRNPKQHYLGIARGYEGKWWIIAKRGHLVKVVSGPFAGRQEAQDRLSRQKRLFNPEWKAPLTKRKKKRLGVLYQKAFAKFSKENPKRKGVLIYGRVLKIFARKTEGPYKGQDFVHTFKSGAIMMGMPDGSLRISHP